MCGHSSRKLTQSDVIDIRLRAAQGEKYSVLAHDKGVAIATISNIAYGRIWKQVGGPRSRRPFNVGRGKTRSKPIVLRQVEALR